MQAIKAFFGKVWAWVLANKVLAGVIAGAVTLAVVTAIVVPVSVSSAKKKKAEQETQQRDDSQTSHTHNWKAPEWTWTGYESAVAHFVCSDDATHTHDETASGTAITSKVTTAADCTHEGTKTYTAAVSFNGQNYTNDKAETLPALGHDVDDYGFCNVCHEYTGELLTSNIVNTVNVGEMAAQSKKFYRIPSHLKHLVKYSELTELTAEELSFFVNLNEGFTPFEVTDSNTPVESLGSDGYIYLVVTASTAKTAASFKFSESHWFSTIGLCYAGDALLDDVVEFKADETVNNISLQNGKHYRYRCPVLQGHAYHVTYTNIAGGDVKLRYAKNNEERTPTPYTDSAIFPEDSFDNYLYIWITSTGVTANGSLTVNTIDHPWNEYGYCPDHIDAYNGLALTIDTLEDSINIPEDNFEVYRFQYKPQHAYTVTDSTAKIKPSMIEAYIFDESGAFTPVTLSDHDYLPNSPVLYVYVVVSANDGDDIINGQLLVEEYHNYNGLGLCSCEDYLGDDLYDGTSSSSFNLVAGDKAYFHYVVVDTHEVSLGVDYAFGNWNASGMDLSKIEVSMYIVTETGFELCEISQAGQMYDEWKTADRFFTAGDEVYIVIENNNESIAATNMEVTVTEMI